MKLYVWTDVLTDYTSGMAVALAPDMETAVILIEKFMGYDVHLPVGNMTVIDLDSNPEPQGWAVHGGG